MRYFNQRRILGATAIVLFGAALSGCSLVEQKASEAAGQLTEAASREFIRQACAPLQDGRIDASEVRVLSALVGAVDGGGLPESIVTPLKELAATGDTAVPAAIQQRLLAACQDAGAYGG